MVRVRTVRPQRLPDSQLVRSERGRIVVVARVHLFHGSAAVGFRRSECGAVGGGDGVERECVDGAVGGEGRRGSADGYPGDYTHEWATLGEGAGAWLNLAWSSPQALTSITLFDRPNPDDQITGGTVTFSDGSSLAVGVLPNDGSPLTLTFAAKTVTSLKLTITSVSSTTQNIGLAEIQAFTGSGSPPSGSLTLSGPASLTAGDWCSWGCRRVVAARL